MTRPIDDIKRIRDFLNEATIDSNARGPYSIASSSPIKKAEPMKSSSISGSTQSKEDKAMNMLQMYTKRLQADPENFDLNDTVKSILKVMNSSHQYGNWTPWWEYIGWIVKGDPDVVELKKLEKFFNDYKNWKEKSSAKPVSAEPAAKAKEPSKLSGWINKFKSK